eukprot:4692024-Pyramimonas_sp.AAC.1
MYSIGCEWREHCHPVMIPRRGRLASDVVERGGLGQLRVRCFAQLLAIDCVRLDNPVGPASRPWK